MTTRRDILKAGIAAGLVASIPDNGEASTVVVAPPAESSSSEVALAVKRYDGGSGSATFNGVAFFEPGQLDAGDETELSIWNGGTELPIYVNALNGAHPDGSLKAVQIQTTLSVADTTPIALTLKLATPPSAGAVTPIDPDLAWQQAMTLLYCTDAEHMCACNITPMPLIPLSDPAIPEDVVTFATDSFDEWVDETVTDETPSGSGNGASYNWSYYMYCRYIMTGNPDDIEEITRIMSDDSSNWSGNNTELNIEYYIPGDANDASISGETIPGSGNWIDVYDDYPNRSGNAWAGEAKSAFKDFFMAYYCTGSEFYRRLLLWHTYPYLNFAQEDITVVGGASAGYYANYGTARFTYRRDCAAHIWCQLSGETHNIGGNGNPQTWDISPKIDQGFNVLSEWDEENFRDGIFGSNPRYTEGGSQSAPGVFPLFQYEVLIDVLIPYYNNIDADSRIPAAMAGAAEYVLSQWTGPHVRRGYNYWVQRYENETDPDTITYAANESWMPTGSTMQGSGAVSYTYMNIHTMAWLYRYNGNPTAKAVVDDLMLPGPVGDTSFWAGGWSGVRRKQLGQTWSNMAHAIAWRYGAPALGY